MSPTQRSLKSLRENGFIVQKVEVWNPFAKVRQDLFGFIDIVAIEKDFRGVLGVQSTTSSNFSARKKKILKDPKALIWVAAGNTIIVHGWGKRRIDGKIKMACLEESIGLERFTSEKV